MDIANAQNSRCISRVASLHTSCHTFSGHGRPVDFIEIGRIGSSLRLECFRNRVGNGLFDFAPTHGMICSRATDAIACAIDRFFLKEFMQVDLMVCCGATGIGTKEVPHQADFHNNLVDVEGMAFSKRQRGTCSGDVGNLKMGNAPLGRGTQRQRSESHKTHFCKCIRSTSAEFGRGFPEQATRDDQQLNLLRTFEDIQDFGVTRPLFK